MITEEQAKIQIKERFWNFKNKLVDISPEYHLTFDHIVSEANSGGVLWDVLELADMHLKSDIKLKGGIHKLDSEDYMEALIFGFKCYT